MPGAVSVVWTSYCWGAQAPITNGGRLMDGLVGVNWVG